MPYDPAVALGIKPPPPPPDALTTLGQLTNIKNSQADAALRAAQVPQIQANTADLQAQAAQRDADLADQNTVQQALRDPAVSKRIHTGDFSDIQGNVQPKTVAALQTQQIQMQNALLTENGEQNTQRIAALKEVSSTAAGLLGLTGPDGQPDLTQINAQLPGVLQRLQASGSLKQAGLDQIALPTSITDVNQLRGFVASTAGLQAASEQAADLKSKAATAAEASGKGAEAQANADRTNFQTQLMKGAATGAGPQAIDIQIPAATYPEANRAAHAAYSAAIGNGTPTALKDANDAVMKIYDQQVGGPQAAAATQKLTLAGDVAKAVQIESATAPIKVATAVKQQAALAANSPEMFAGINDPVSRRAAQTDYQKVTEAYLDKAGMAQQLKDFIAASQSRNKAAPGLIPLSELRTVVNRVNRQELEQVSSGAGSVADRVQGWFNGATEGQKIPPEILQDMNRIADIESANSRAVYVNKVNAQKATYGGNVRPVDPPPGAAAVAGGYTRTANGPGGHTIGSNDNWATWYDTKTGQKLSP